MEQPHLFDNTDKDDSGVPYWMRKCIAELRAEIERDREKGCQCKICDQNVKLYKRNFNSAMAQVMIAIYKENRRNRDYSNGTDIFKWENHTKWIQVENLLKADASLPSSIRGDFPKAVHFGLLEKQKGERDDGSNRMGWYQLTEKGANFVEGYAMIPRWVTIYNNTVIDFSRDEITLQQALGTKFNYHELMKGE